MRRHQTKSLAFTAILVAFGILIPMVMPVKVVIGPASFTLASHVPVFMAMFISPQVAVLVALGTSLGFLLAGFPIVIVLRAVSHLLFAVVGAVMIKNTQPCLKASFDIGISDFLKPFTRLSRIYRCSCANSWSSYRSSLYLVFSRLDWFRFSCSWNN